MEKDKTKHHWTVKEIAISATAILATVGLCIAGVYYRDSLMNTELLARWGLLGVLVVAFLAGSTFSVTAIPVPYWMVVFTLPGLLDESWGIWAPIWVGIIAGLGASLGQFITFLIGYGGRGLSRKLSSKFNSDVYDKAIAWAEKHGSWSVFLMSLMVNPLHLPMTIAIATLKYPPHKFFIYSFLGVALKSLIISFCGYFGINSLLSFLDA